MHLESALAELQQKGYRMTNARKAILRMFGDGCNPLSAQDMHQQLQKKGLSVNLTTVYRELQFLTEQHLLHTVQFEDGVQRYEPSHQDHHHHHAVCMQCHEVQDIVMEPDLTHIEHALQKKMGFTVTRHSLEFYGLCKQCHMKRA